MRKSNDLVTSIVGIVLIIILLIGGIGWVKNFIALLDCDFETPYKCEVVHALGVIPPVGAITGWLDAGK